jgi:polyamine oxidase
MIQKPRVIIIGAGMAGLAAARALVASHYDVKILEARNRIGGRTWTEDFSGVPFDVGAFILHGTQNNPIVELADQANVKFSSLENPSFLMNSKQQYSVEQLDFYEELFHSLLSEASDYALQAPADISLAQAIEFLKHNEKFASIPAELFNWQASFLPLWSGADADKLSARNWNRDEMPLEGGNHLVLNGYKPIVQLLAQDLDIKFNININKIHYDAEGVTVYSDDASYHADKVIITLPLGVLKQGKIIFNPPLPISKTDAIQQLAMGVLDKIIMKFAQPFWQSDIPSLTYLESSDTPWSRFINGVYFFKQPVLISAAGGHYASEFEKLDIGEVQQIVMDNLRKCFGNDIPEPIAVRMTRWHQDVYSYGSYSFIPVGASGETYDVMAQSVDDKLFFAGEATHRQYPGMVHGAYISGVREANKIIDGK